MARRTSSCFALLSKTLTPCQLKVLRSLTVIRLTVFLKKTTGNRDLRETQDPQQQSRLESKSQPITHLMGHFYLTVPRDPKCPDHGIWECSCFHSTRKQEQTAPSCLSSLQCSVLTRASQCESCTVLRYFKNFITSTKYVAAHLTMHCEGL